MPRRWSPRGPPQVRAAAGTPVGRWAGVVVVVTGGSGLVAGVASAASLDEAPSLLDSGGGAIVRSAAGAGSAAGSGSAALPVLAALVEEGAGAGRVEGGTGRVDGGTVEGGAPSALPTPDAGGSRGELDDSKGTSWETRSTEPTQNGSVCGAARKLRPPRMTRIRTAGAAATRRRLDGVWRREAEGMHRQRYGRMRRPGTGKWACSGWGNPTPIGAERPAGSR